MQELNHHPNGEIETEASEEGGRMRGGKEEAGWQGGRGVGKEGWQEGVARRQEVGK